jgi:hypothetical protein
MDMTLGIGRSRELERWYRPRRRGADAAEIGVERGASA